MRTSIRVGLLAVCLGLAGCSLFNKKSGGSPSGSKPFLGTGSGSGSGSGTSSGGTETASADTGAPPPGANGLLAGQVVDRSSRRPSKVYIQVIDLQETKTTAAPLEYEPREDGFFVIQGLKLGHHYRLIARAKDGDKTLSGTTLAMPPNPRLSIFLNEDAAGAATPAVPDPPTVPGTKPTGNSEGAAALDPPVKAKPGDGTSAPKFGDGAPSNPTGSGSTWTPPPTQPPLAPDRMARDVKDGFTIGRPAPAPVDMPGPLSPVYTPPPAPPWNSTRDTLPPVTPRPAQPQPPVLPAVKLPAVPTQVPSCVRVGDRVENFALYDLNSQPWELRTRKNRGKLVLLDFWFSECPACWASFKHLNAFQKKYGPDGLEVIGINYDKGTPAEQVVKARNTRARHSIAYTTLLGTGATCPVKTQLEVEQYPTVFLLDENGLILWNGAKVNIGEEYERQDLEIQIRKHLYGSR